MGLIDTLKREATDKGIRTHNPKEEQLERLFNKMFYLDKKENIESEFVEQMITRGMETKERVGLHASSIIKSDKEYCVREQVLSLLFKQIQGDNVAVKLKRIFEEGNAVHEKWQRLFLRAGYCDVNQLDYTKINKEYQLSYTPDAEIFVPEIFDEDEIIVEIKSMNDYTYSKIEGHPAGEKQVDLYMYLENKKHGIVLCENKNTQEFKVIWRDFDYKNVVDFEDRLSEIKVRYNFYLNDGTLPPRRADFTIDCKKCKACNMRNACYRVGFGRVRI